MAVNDVKVTVVCITYKHEDYIAEALESFVRQKTNFKFQVFVGEDHGPDRTAEIVREYAKKYPDIIVPFIREENMGGMGKRNLIDLCQRASSPYIAFCEGDDYWVDDYKLQKQYDYMEANPELRGCFTKTQIVAPEDWHLNEFYENKRDKQGRILYPDCQDGWVDTKEPIGVDVVLKCLPAHTSSMFFRWNYDLVIPEWFYDGIIGDAPIMMLQMGDGKFGYIPEITSVYRRSDVGIFMSGSTQEHFINTRRDYIRYLSGIYDYFSENYGDYCRNEIANRIRLETANYFGALFKENNMAPIAQLINDFPNATQVAMQSFNSAYWDSCRMTGAYTWDGTVLVARNRWFIHILKPFVRLAVVIQKAFNFVVEKLRHLISFLCYWLLALVPKRKNLWVFTGFYKKGYFDNTKYMYEYLLANHPEIRAVWLTQDPEVLEQLRAEGKPVYTHRSLKGRWLLTHASLAFTDHYRMADYSNICGYNARTGLVQLWHGVGLKSIGDLRNTDVPGVMISDDICPRPEDSRGTRFIKRLKYIRYAPFRELFEKYYLFTITGEERIEMIAKPWHVPEENWFMAGQPRNLPLYTTERDAEHPRVLFAPTYRWNSDTEKHMVQRVIDAMPDIQKYMESVDGYFVIRLHPHTWRNYSEMIGHFAKQHDRISFDTEKDIYPTLAKYSVVITDYSSIAFEFVLIDRPAIFYCYDYEDFIAHEGSFHYDYWDYAPGTKTRTWDENIAAIDEYIKHPEKDREWRRKVSDLLFDPQANTIDSSENITNELKRRLGMRD